jgi:hypothetical protein
MKKIFKGFDFHDILIFIGVHLSSQLLNLRLKNCFQKRNLKLSNIVQRIFPDLFISKFTNLLIKQQIITSKCFYILIFAIKKIYFWSRWISTNLDEEEIKVSHDPDKKSLSNYEPFYVSPNTIPDFQERFIGYGWTRNSQVKSKLRLKDNY